MTPRSPRAAVRPRYEHEVGLEPAAELGEARPHALGQAERGGVDAGLLCSRRVDRPGRARRPAGRSPRRRGSRRGPGPERLGLTGLEPRAGAARLRLVEAEGEVEDARRRPRRIGGAGLLGRRRPGAPRLEAAARPEPGAGYVAPGRHPGVEQGPRHPDRHLVRVPVDRHCARRQRRRPSVRQRGHLAAGAPGGDEAIESGRADPGAAGPGHLGAAAAVGIDADATAAASSASSVLSVTR